MTKITAPRANNPTLRPRLFQQLDQFRGAAVIWLVGPPGAGKTTLASTYLSQRQDHHLWYQLDAGDADPATFFYYFRLAVQQAAPGERLELPPLTPEFLPSLTTFVRRYAEVIATNVKQPTLCVLDNFEQVPEDSPLPLVIRELASCFPPEIGFLVLSRAEPPPAFARLRMYGQLATVDGDDLNLTMDEAREIAAARQSASCARWTSEQIARVHNETRGWIAGFTLLLGDRRQAASGYLGLSGAPQLVFDYFATELFEHYPSSVQQGLLCTALLPMMTIPNVDRLTGDPQIKTVLADLQRRNCFVVQRGQVEPVYEYHALFRAFLLNRAIADLPPDEWRVMQQNAADLLADSRQADAAAHLYRTVEHWPSLSALALREGPTLISEGRHQTLDLWLDCLPADFYEQSPWLCYWRGMARLPFDPLGARAHFEQAYGGFRSTADVEGLYSAWAGIMDSFFYEWQDLRPADRWIAEFEALRTRYPEFPSRAAELRTYWAMGTLLHRQPQHPFVPAWAKRAEAMLNVSDRELSVLLGGYLVIHHLWRGDSAKALDLIRRLDPWTRSADFPPLVSILWACAVGLYHSVRGDLEACLEVVEAGLLLARKTGLNCWDFLLSAQAARCSLVAGKLIDADTWITRMATTMRNHSHINGGFIEHLRTNVAGQRGEWPRAVEHARKGLVMALESGVPFLEAHCRIDLARALVGQGDRDEWREHLRIANAIGQGMDSKVLQYLCLEVKARSAFERDEPEAGRDWLGQAFELSRLMGEPIWQMAGPLAIARQCEHALAFGIETNHVQQLIRRRRLTPPDPATCQETWPWPVRILTLGRFALLCDPEPPCSSRKAQLKPLELIKALCAFGGQAIHQDQVTEALWPDAEGDAADQALGTTLHRLRKLLRHEQAIRLENRQLSLNSRYVWVDALAFDRIARQANRAERASLQSAFDRYGGHFLPGESAPWALAFRERLRGRFLKVAERLAALLENAGDWPAAIDCYEKVIEIEPAAESFHRRLMICHAQLGQRAEAMAVFQRCRQSLLTNLGVTPTGETQDLYQRLREG